MTLNQYNLSCLSHYSYLIGDDGVAAVVDPQRDVDQYLADAEARGLAIKYVILTHFHADFVAGHVELREKTGAEIIMGRGAGSEIPVTHVGDGDTLRLGAVRLDFLQTPGHTPEGISVVVTDENRDTPAPQAVLTGDTLFLGDVGRPDLMASVGVTAEELAGQMYDSLHRKLLTLPDTTLVYPAHGAGSACGRHMTSESSTTLGVQRATNWALQPMERDAFVRALVENQPTAPGYFAYDADLNRRPHDTLETAMASSLKPLSAAQMSEHAHVGAQILDTRGPDAFAASHLRGSVNIGLEGRYASWAGTVLDAALPIVLITDPGREEEAVVRLGRIGYDRVLGYAEDGIETFRGSHDLVAARRFSPDELADSLPEDPSLLVVDIRADAELENGTIDGSLHIPLEEFGRRASEVPPDRPVVLMCAGGYRSSIGASLLRRAGHTGVRDLAGGYTAWRNR